MSSALYPGRCHGAEIGAQAIAGGGQHTCAVTRAGGAKCWGENRVGQVGSRPTPNGRTPVPIKCRRAQKRSQSDRRGLRTHLCANERRRGQVLGRRGYGERLEDENPTISTPVYIAGLTSGVTAITAGFDQNLRNDQRRRGKVLGLGISNGQLGKRLRRPSATPRSMSPASPAGSA